MRSVFLATLVAAGIGLVGSAGPIVAAPVNGAVIGEATQTNSPVVRVQHRRGRSYRYHLRGRSWRYRTHWRARSYRYHWRSRSWRYHNRALSSRSYHARWRSWRVPRCHAVPFSFWVAC